MSMDHLILKTEKTNQNRWQKLVYYFSLFREPALFSVLLSLAAHLSKLPWLIAITTLLYTPVFFVALGLCELILLLLTLKEFWKKPSSTSALAILSSLSAIAGCGLFVTSLYLALPASIAFITPAAFVLMFTFKIFASIDEIKIALHRKLGRALAIANFTANLLGISAITLTFLFPLFPAFPVITAILLLTTAASRIISLTYQAQIGRLSIMPSKLAPSLPSPSSFDVPTLAHNPASSPVTKATLLSPRISPTTTTAATSSSSASSLSSASSSSVSSSASSAIAVTTALVAAPKRPTSPQHRGRSPSPTPANTASPRLRPLSPSSRNQPRKAVTVDQLLRFQPLSPIKAQPKPPSQSPTSALTSTMTSTS